MFQNNFVKRILSMTLAVCLVLSLAALIEPKGYTVSAEAERVLLANSEEANYEQLTFSDFDIADGEILTQGNGKHYTSAVLEGDLNEVLLRGKYTFPTKEASLKPGNIYWGLAKWYGVSLNMDSAGNILLDIISNGSATTTNKSATNLTANSPVDFRGQEVELDISIKYENTTSTTTDVKIGAWINGELQPAGYIYVTNVPLNNLIRCFHTYDTDPNASLTVKSVKGEIKPEKKDVLLSESEENDYEKLTFSDFGVADGEILTEAKWTSETKDGGLDEILFRGKYTFPAADQVKQFGNIYLGKADWWTIVLNSDSAGNLCVDAIGATFDDKTPINLTATNPELQLRGREVEIDVSVKYENTTSTTTDLKIGVWIDGVLSKGGYIYAKNVPLSNLTRCLHFYDAAAGSGVPVKSVKDGVTPDPEPQDVLLADSEENNYEKLTFADFGIPDGDILNQGVNQHFVSDVVPEGDLNEILFRGKYTFPTIEQAKQFGNIYLGKAKHYGIAITTDGSGNILLDVISTSTGGSVIEKNDDRNMTLNSPVELRGQEVEIAISVKYENTTSDTTDLKIGVWINGVLMQGKYLYARGVALSDLNRCFHTVDTNNDTTVKVASVGKTYTPPDVLLSESEENNYEKLTFADFGIPDGDILNQGVNQHFVSDVVPEGDLNEILFRGKYTFPTIEQGKQFGNIYLGKYKYYGIAFTTDGSGNILLDVISTSTGGSVIEKNDDRNMTLNSPVELRGQEVEIAISVKYENTTSDTTDLKIGVWINGVLMQGKYLYARGVALSDLIRCFHTLDVSNETTVKVASVGKTYTPPDVLLSESEENNYEKLTFADFGAMDGQLLTGNAGEKTNYATLPGTLDGILFQGKYNFPGMDQAKQFGNIYLGRPDWNAIGFTQDGAGNINFTVVSTGSSIDDASLCNLSAGNPKVQWRENEDLEIAISVKYENTTTDKTDLKIGIWVNGVLHKGKYIYARNVLLSDLTRCLHTYDSANGCGVGVTSIGQWEVNTLPTDFADLTLSDGNIPDGDTFTYGNFARIESLDKTLFSANVQFNTTGARLHLGCTPGATNGYSGMGLRLESAGTLVLGNELGVPAEEKPNVLTSIGLNYFVFNARAAGLGNTFAGKNFLLQISTEFVDCDNDGEKDDIKLGVFFDGVLYCNNYIYIPNEAQTLSTGVNFNGGNKGFAQFSSVRIKELTNADLGINKGAYTATVNGEAGSDSLNGTAVTTEVTFGKGASISYGKEGKGIVFTYAGEGVLKISHVKADGTSVAIGEVKISGKGAAKLRTTMELIKAGEKTNLKLGVFVNGKLSGYQYLVVEDVDTSVLTRGMSVIPNGAEVRIGENTYETVTLRDFILADKTRSDYGGRFASYESAGYNGTAFSAVLGFSDETEKKNDNCFYLGGKQWAGLRVDLNANGNLAFSFVHADGTLMQLVKVTPEEVGMETFQGKNFDYRVTFDVIETVAGKLNAVIGIYVNGVLCGDAYQLVKSVDAVVLERGLFSYVDKNGGSLTMKSTNTTVDFTIFGFTGNWKNTLGIK